jgi:hypothetical protein
MDALDPRKIVAEVAARHGIKIDAKDPMLAVVTLNELALTQFTTPVVERIEDAERRFEKAAERLQECAGGVLTREVERAAIVLRAEIQTDIEDARLNAGKMVLELNEAHKRHTLYRLVATSLTCAVIIFLLGVWIGWKL